jgi:hypothetical protein
MAAVRLQLTHRSINDGGREREREREKDQKESEVESKKRLLFTGEIKNNRF